MSVGLLAVRLLYRFYVCVHLSKWFTFFSVFSRLFLVVVSSFTLAGNAQIDEGLLRVISLDSLISPEYTNNRADWRNACYSLSLFRFIQRAGHFGEVGGGDMGVAQGGFNGAMPKQFLDPAQVGAAFQQVRRETMP